MPIDFDVFKNAFDLPPADAIKYLESKGLVPSWSWKDVTDAAAQRSFAVAKVTKLDLLNTIHKALTDAQRSGKTMEQFRTELEPTLRKAGWWGKGKDPKTGKDVQLGSPWRLNTIFRTNMQSGYMAGRLKQQKELIQARPYWQYIAVGDARTRPSHLKLNGTVLRADDPFWNKHYPPNGFNCRCRVRTLSEKQLKREGLTPIDSSKPPAKDFAPDDGFAANPEQPVTLTPDAAKYPKSLADAAAKEQPPKQPAKVEAPATHEDLLKLVDANVPKARAKAVKEWLRKNFGDKVPTSAELSAAIVTGGVTLKDVIKLRGALSPSALPVAAPVKPAAAKPGKPVVIKPEIAAHSIDPPAKTPTNPPRKTSAPGDAERIRKRAEQIANGEKDNETLSIKYRQFESQIEHGDIKRVFAKQISLQEEATLRTYTSQAYAETNLRARQGRLTPTDKAFIEQIDEALSKLPRYTRSETFRDLQFSSGTDLQAFLDKHKPGSEIQYPHPVSTSVSGSFAPRSNVRCVIKSKSGALIEDISQAPEEREVLLPSTARYKVTKVGIAPISSKLRRPGNPNQYVVHLEEI